MSARFTWESVSPSFHHIFWGFSTFINTLWPRQNGRHYADDTSKHIFLNEIVIISIKISLKCFPKYAISSIPSLVQITARRQAIIWTNDGLLTDANIPLELNELRHKTFVWILKFSIHPAFLIYADILDCSTLSLIILSMFRKYCIPGQAILSQYKCILAIAPV